MELGLQNKTAIITGGTRGIGLAIAAALAREGVKVSICGRDAARLDKAAGDLQAQGHDVHAAVCDVADKQGVAAYIAEAADALGGLNILVNNASGFGRSDDEAGWQAGIDVDLMGSLRASWAATPRIEASGGGSILHISSIAGFKGSLRTPAYSAIKATLIQYTLSQALALSKKNIRVNCIAPGSIYFEEGTWHDAKLNDRPLYEATLKSIPFGRFGTPEEVASAAVFLTSDAASWVTGQTLSVDGGQLL